MRAGSIRLERTESAEWLALSALDDAGFDFIAANRWLFGSRRVRGEISLVLETFRLDGFLRFCHKYDIEARTPDYGHGD